MARPDDAGNASAGKTSAAPAPPARRAAPVALAAILVALLAAGCFDRILPVGPRYSPQDYVSAKDYRSWIIEVDYVEGSQPPQSALDNALNTLRGVVSKPDGISVRLGDALPRNNGAYSVDDVDRLVSAHRDFAHGKDGHATTYLLYLDGHSDQDNNEGTVLGFAKGDVIALFSQSIRNVSNCVLAVCQPPLETVHTAVLTHELGHSIGLVNNGVPMRTPHEDSAHPKHSDNERSVMYWAVETGNIVSLLRNGGSIPTGFDAKDKADLCDAGGKC